MRLEINKKTPFQLTCRTHPHPSINIWRKKRHPRCAPKGAQANKKKEAQSFCSNTAIRLYPSPSANHLLLTVLAPALDRKQRSPLSRPFFFSFLFLIFILKSLPGSSLSHFTWSGIESKIAKVGNMGTLFGSDDERGTGPNVENGK